MTDELGGGYGPEQPERGESRMDRRELLRTFRPSDRHYTPTDQLSDDEIIAQFKEEQRRLGLSREDAPLREDAPGETSHRQVEEATGKPSADPQERSAQSGGIGERSPETTDRAEVPEVFDLDRHLGDDPDAPTVREVLEHYAGPDGLTEEQAAADQAYVARHLSDRPWLKIAADTDPLVRHVICDRDRSGGHDLQLHDGWRDEQAQADRVQHRRDPAHATDSSAYFHATDAVRGGDTLPGDTKQRMKEQHNSGESATRIPSATDYTVASARVHSHPRVQEALEKSPSERVPKAIEDLPITEILGSDGHERCEGYRLATDEFASSEEVRYNARSWTREVRTELVSGAADFADATDRVRRRVVTGELNLVEPRAEQIDSFEGGTFLVAFRRTEDRSGFEVTTMFPRPAQRNVDD